MAFRFPCSSTKGPTPRADKILDTWNFLRPALESDLVTNVISGTKGTPWELHAITVKMIKRWYVGKTDFFPVKAFLRKLKSVPLGFLFLPISGFLAPVQAKSPILQRIRVKVVRRPSACFQPLIRLKFLQQFSSTFIIVLSCDRLFRTFLSVFRCMGDLLNHVHRDILS